MVDVVATCPALPVGVDVPAADWRGRLSVAGGGMLDGVGDGADMVLAAVVTEWKRSRRRECISRRGSRCQSR